MRYDQKDQESSNVEDRRQERGGTGGGGFSFPGSQGGGGGFPFPMPGSGGGTGGFSLTTMLIVGALMLLFGLNPLDLLRGATSGGAPSMPQQPRMEPGPRQAGQAPGRSPFDLPGMPGGQGGGGAPTASQDQMKQFVGRVLKDNEDVWNKVFASFGRQYEEPKLVVFSGSTRTACGPGISAMGPFYCPLDRKIYIDLVFYQELQRRFKAPGDFAQAYVISHEVGHHVQTLLGIADKVQNMKQRMPEKQGNALQVRMELQADCLAGVWANLTHQIKNRLEPGDIEEGLNAATAIGDDMIQKQTQGYVVPESFTHGSSQQRVRWFRKGLETGQMQQCDTFNATDL